MTDIERAVKAAFCAEFSAGNYHEGPLADKYRQGLFKADIIRIERCVRAAIEAMMDPSDGPLQELVNSMALDCCHASSVGHAKHVVQLYLRAVLGGK